METRVIVADNNRARIFASHSTLKRLEEMDGFVHPEARLTNSELVGDSAGRTADQQSTLDPATSAREQEERDFARLLARHLKALHNEQHYEQLFLVAPPQFLGALRKALPAPLDQLVNRTIDKDLTTADIGTILDYIRA